MVGRAETLSSVFFLAAFILYTKSTKRKRVTGNKQMYDWLYNSTNRLSLIMELGSSILLISWSTVGHNLEPFEFMSSIPMVHFNIILPFPLSSMVLLIYVTCSVACGDSSLSCPAHPNYDVSHKINDFWKD